MRSERGAESRTVPVRDHVTFLVLRLGRMVSKGFGKARCSQTKLGCPEELEEALAGDGLQLCQPLGFVPLAPNLPAAVAPTAG
jgi:hypothetical protein